MLFLQLTEDYGLEAELIQATGAVAHGITAVPYKYNGAQELWNYLSQSTHESYEYIFIGAHGNAHGVYSDDGIAMTWSDLSFALCGNPGLTQECVVYLGCCKGGLERIANILMLHCSTIHYVCGSTCNITPNESGAAFRTFCEHHRHGATANKIESAVSAATTKGFSVYSRYERDLILAQLKLITEATEPDSGILPEAYYQGGVTSYLPDELSAQEKLKVATATQAVITVIDPDHH